MTITKSWQKTLSQIARNQDYSVFIAPTEGLWGLSGKAASPLVCTKISELKQRPNHKGFIVLYSSKVESHIRGWVDWNKLGPVKTSQYFSKRDKFVTYLLPASSSAPAHLVREGKISLRYATFGSIKRILDNLGFALVSTSANISGQPPLCSLKQLKATFPSLSLVRGLLGGRKRGSSIIDLEDGKTLR